MAEEALEPVNLNKRKLVDDLTEELDDTKIRLAKLRKHQPSKLRSIARRISSNTIHYYSRFCVKVDTHTEHLNLHGPLVASDLPDLLNTETSNLNELSKAVLECLAERSELMKVHQQLVGQDSSSRCNSRRRRHRFYLTVSPNMDNSDFNITAS